MCRDSVFLADFVNAEAHVDCKLVHFPAIPAAGQDESDASQRQDQLMYSLAQMKTSPVVNWSLGISKRAPAAPEPYLAH
ncbi:hypothetical protein D3C73_1613560 [compost metagenome]